MDHERYNEIHMSGCNSTAKQLTFNVPCISESCVEMKMKLNFSLHISLWCLKRFYEGL